MIETYAIAAGALIVIGAVLGIFVIRALGARIQRSHRAAVAHFDRIAVTPRTARNADAVVISGSPRPSITRQPQLTLAGRAATTGSWQ